MPRRLLEAPLTTDIVFRTLEKISADCSPEDKEYARILLDFLLKDPITWLTDVSSQMLLGICSQFKA